MLICLRLDRGKIASSLHIPQHTSLYIHFENASPQESLCRLKNRHSYRLHRVKQSCSAPAAGSDTSTSARQERRRPPCVHCTIRILYITTQRVPVSTTRGCGVDGEEDWSCRGGEGDDKETRCNINHLSNLLRSCSVVRAGVQKGRTVGFHFCLELCRLNFASSRLS